MAISFHNNNVEEEEDIKYKVVIHNHAYLFKCDYRLSHKKVTFRMLLKPQCTLSITSSRHLPN